MIEPNFNFMLWAMLIINTLLGITYIIAGATSAKKIYEERHGTTTVLSGVIYILISVIVIFT